MQDVRVRVDKEQKVTRVRGKGVKSVGKLSFVSFEMCVKAALMSS